MLLIGGTVKKNILQYDDRTSRSKRPFFFSVLYRQTSKRSLFVPFLEQDPVMR